MLFFILWSVGICLFDRPFLLFSDSVSRAKQIDRSYTHTRTWISSMDLVLIPQKKQNDTMHLSSLFSNKSSLQQGKFRRTNQKINIQKTRNKGIFGGVSTCWYVPNIPPTCWYAIQVYFRLKHILCLSQKVQSTSLIRLLPFKSIHMCLVKKIRNWMHVSLICSILSLESDLKRLIRTILKVTKDSWLWYIGSSCLSTSEMRSCFHWRIHWAHVASDSEISGPTCYYCNEHL